MGFLQCLKESQWMTSFNKDLALMQKQSGVPLPICYRGDLGCTARTYSMNS